MLRITHNDDPFGERYGTLRNFIELYVWGKSSGTLPNFLTCMIEWNSHARQLMIVR